MCWKARIKRWRWLLITDNFSNSAPPRELCPESRFVLMRRTAFFSAPGMGADSAVQVRYTLDCENC